MSEFCLVAVLHLPPLPGAANYAGDSVRKMAESAAEDAAILEAAGFHAVMIQDASDNPQANEVDSPTVAALTAIGTIVRGATDLPLGVVVGHNDGAAAVAIAHAVEAQFVRVKVLTGVAAGPTGWIEGCAMPVAQMKRRLGNSVEVWADAHEATSLAVAGDTGWAAAEAVSFGGADKLIVTRDSGVADAVEAIASVKAAMGGDVDIVIGGRVTGDTLELAMAGSDGAILGTVLKGGREFRVDPAVANELGARALTFSRNRKGTNE